MRAALPALAALILVGCSQPAAPPAATEASTTPVAEAPPPAPERTDAQRQAALAALPAPYNTANLENGQSRFALCRSCHTITQGGAVMTGPNLFGVVGRRAGAVAGFNYSDGLRNAGFSRDAAHLDTWLTNPRAMIAGTRMTYAGMSDATARRDLIAYLMVEGAPAPAATPAP